MSLSESKKEIEMKCCFCTNEIEKQYTPTGEMYWDRGHNPEPVRGGEDRCCDFCNLSIVMPARISQLLFNEEEQANDDQTHPC